MNHITQFEEIKKLTEGYLNAETYQALYNCALEARRGCIVDIGPAQGGSTISFALAAQKNNSITKVFSIDKFKGSNALKYFDDVEKNIHQVTKNLERYHIEQYMTPIVYGCDDIKQVIGNEPISILFIDADGAVDRDMELYYNQIIEDGIIIIDDFENKINVQASTRFLKWRTQEQIDVFLKANDIDSLKMFTPLGKHYTTYRLIHYFIEKNCIEVIKEVDNTLFARKSNSQKIFDNTTKKDMLQIRDEIVEDFQHRRIIVTQCYDKIEDQLKIILEKSKSNNIILFENYYYPAKFRFHTVKVLEVKENVSKTFDEYVQLQDINLESIDEYINKLEKGESIRISCSDINNEIFYPFKEAYQNGELHIYPILLSDRFWGFIVFSNQEQDSFSIGRNDMNDLMEVVKSVSCMIHDISYI